MYCIHTETHLEEKGNTKTADLLAEGQRVLPELLEVHLLNGWMQMALLFNELHQQSILRRKNDPSINQINFIDPTWEIHLRLLTISSRPAMRNTQQSTTCRITVKHILNNHTSDCG